MGAARTAEQDRTPAAPASSTRRRLPLGPRYEACGGEAQSRPCPRAECRYYLEDPAPSLFGADESRPTCALDVATLGGIGQDPLGELLGVTGEAIRQTILEMLPRLRKRCAALGISPADFMHAHGAPWPEEIEDAPRGGGRRRRAAAQASLFGGEK